MWGTLPNASAVMGPTLAFDFQHSEAYFFTPARANYLQESVRCDDSRFWLLRNLATDTIDFGAQANFAYAFRDSPQLRILHDTDGTLKRRHVPEKGGCRSHVQEIAVHKRGVILSLGASVAN